MVNWCKPYQLNWAMAVRLISHINALVLLLYIYRLYLLCLENNIGKFTTNNNIKKGISTCGSFACICGLCAWVDLLRAFVDCVCECGSLACICGRIWYCFHSIMLHHMSVLWHHCSFNTLLIVTKTFCIKYINNVGLQVPVITSKLVAVYNTFLEIESSIILKRKLLNYFKRFILT